MATFKYFSDIDGEAIELSSPWNMSNKEFAAKFPGVKGLKADGYSMWVGYRGNEVLPLTRRIEYKRNPSLHVCNAKCLGGKINGTCECQCGGKNHGAGMFSRLLEAA